MEKVTIIELVLAVDGKLISGAENAFIDAVSIDSRTVTNTTLFVPIKGERLDGHDFIDAAIRNGAKVVLTDHDDTEVYEDVAVIKVFDTTVALGDFAKFYLSKKNVKVIAVTGSVGKTSTKEMIYSVINRKYRTCKTAGNFNNHIGLPLTIFNIKDEDEVVILEMGMSHFGEIDYLAAIAPPDIGVITNIGLSHIENLGSRDGILRAKLEMVKHLKKSGVMLMNVDNDMLAQAFNTIETKKIAYGIYADKLDYRGENCSSKNNGVAFTVTVGSIPYAVQVPALGEYNVYNALCAIVVGTLLGISMGEIVLGICEYTNADMRMSVQKSGENTLIVDCYNAAPDSMKEAIKVLSGMDGGRKVAVLGDMKEMGSFSKDAHINVGKVIFQYGVDVLVAIGEHAQDIAEGAKTAGMNKSNIHCFDNNSKFMGKCSSIISEKDVILLKASRAMKFEEIVQYIKKK